MLLAVATVAQCAIECRWRNLCWHMHVIVRYARSPDSSGPSCQSQILNSFPGKTHSRSTGSTPASHGICFAAFAASNHSIDRGQILTASVSISSVSNCRTDFRLKSNRLTASTGKRMQQALRVCPGIDVLAFYDSVQTFAHHLISRA